jgi:long-chain acyl-CoA synthetase
MAEDTNLDTFPKLLHSHVKLRPDQDAMREKDLGIWQSWTWSEAATEIRALACGLASLGLKRGEKLAIIGDNRPRLYWGMTAAQALGAIPVPLYQDSVADEMAYVLDNADVKIALVENQEQVDKMLEVRDRCPRIEHIIYDEFRGLRNYKQEFLHDFEKVQQAGIEYDHENPERSPKAKAVTSVSCFTPRVRPETRKAWSCPTTTSSSPRATVSCARA